MGVVVVVVNKISDSSRVDPSDGADSLERDTGIYVYIYVCVYIYSVREKEIYMYIYVHLSI